MRQTEKIRPTQTKALYKNPWKDSPKGPNPKTAIEEFLQGTSIPGLFQYAQQDHWFGKLTWTTILIAGLTLSFYQSWEIFFEYFEYKTYQQSVLRSNDTLPFPAVTVCNKNPIKWYNESNPTEFQIDFRDAEELAYIGKGLDPEKLPSIAKRYLGTWLLNDELNIKQNDDSNPKEGIDYFKFEELLPIKTWNYRNLIGDKYGREFFQFPHPLYGWCFTFNSGIKGTAHYVDPSKELIFIMYINDDLQTPFLTRSNGFVFYIHEQGTPPILSSPTAISLDPGELMRVGITMQKFNRLPPPYPSKCIDKINMGYREKMIYFYPDTSPYLYSSEGCRTTHQQLMTKADKRFDCINPKIPYYQGKVESTCFFEKEDLRNFFPDFKPHRMDCPLLCEELQYVTRLKYVKKPFRTKFYQGFIKTAAPKLFKELEEKHNNLVNDLERNLVGFQLHFETDVYEDTIEQAKYTIADLWGAVGGNIGFWTGLSVLSVMEIIDLLLICCRKPPPRERQVSSKRNHQLVKSKNAFVVKR